VYDFCSTAVHGRSAADVSTAYVATLPRTVYESSSETSKEVRRLDSYGLRGSARTFRRRYRYSHASHYAAAAAAGSRQHPSREVLDLVFSC